MNNAGVNKYAKWYVETPRDCDMGNDGKLPWEVAHMYNVHGVLPMWRYRATVIDRCLNSKYRLVRIRRVYKIIDRLRRNCVGFEEPMDKRSLLSACYRQGGTC